MYYVYYRKHFEIKSILKLKRFEINLKMYIVDLD